MDRWNKADSTLVFAAVCFLIAVVIRLNTDSILAEGFLFVTEAALVGGIADWFAVTALFKKPLGFPFHTAILPRRRAEFIEASTTMVQQEFFSRRTLFKKVGKFQFLPMLIKYLEQPETRRFFLAEISKALKKYLESLDKTSLAKTLAGKLRREFENIPARDLIREGGKWLRDSGKDTELFVGLIKKIRETAAKPETRAKLQEELEKFAAERTKSAGAFSLLMAGLAQMLNFVNFEEAAEIMQTQLVKLLDELSVDSPIQRSTLNECRKKISALAETPEFRDLVERLQVDLAADLPIEGTLEIALSKFRKQILLADINELLPVAQDSKTISEVFAQMLIDFYSKFVELLKTDSAIKKAVEKFIYELTVRAAIYAQPLVGTVATEALNRMTVDELNNLVYDKAEPDFVWIRMNGSIVGSVVGIFIFIIINLF